MPPNKEGIILQLEDYMGLTTESFTKSAFDSIRLDIFKGRIPTRQFRSSKFRIYLEITDEIIVITIGFSDLEIV